ncbi:MAG: zinc ribbon domain-containing protein [Deltaproteobacteria bacterium]|nr:zinc ribbon domain-containing protein [Deltaproteobacteria bacterium]
MPIFDFLCLECGKINEILITADSDNPSCTSCGSSRLKKLLSAHSGLSGPTKNTLPGPGDTTCCGSSPGHAGCAGPGSCCGKTS